MNSLATAVLNVLTDEIVSNYKDVHAETLIQDPEFARWLENEYVPIAGAWQY